MRRPVEVRARAPRGPTAATNSCCCCCCRHRTASGHGRCSTGATLRHAALASRLPEQRGILVVVAPKKSSTPARPAALAALRQPSRHARFRRRQACRRRRAAAWWRGGRGKDISPVVIVVIKQPPPPCLWSRLAGRQARLSRAARARFTRGACPNPHAPKQKAVVVVVVVAKETDNAACFPCCRCHWHSRWPLLITRACAGAVGFDTCRSGARLLRRWRHVRADLRHR